MLLFGNLTYAYDPSGQRISAAAAWRAPILPEDNQSTTDAANRLTGFNNQSLTYDANGNLTGDGINTYTWNARNQLIQITGAVNAGFTYDATGRRKSKTVNGQTTNYLYDGNNILQEQTGTSLKAGYLMGGIDEIFTRQTPGQAYNYLTDALGSVVRLTDNTGNKLVDYTYDPYGNTTADAAVDNPFQYTGRENDQTGLYYYRARYYSPTYQRFISEDPIGLSGGINVYAYVGGDPLGYTDPFGEQAQVRPSHNQRASGNGRGGQGNGRSYPPVYRNTPPPPPPRNTGGRNEGQPRQKPEVKPTNPGLDRAARNAPDLGDERRRRRWEGGPGERIPPMAPPGTGYTCYYVDRCPQPDPNACRKDDPPPILAGLCQPRIVCDLETVGITSW